MAAKVIVESFKKILAGSEPSPFTRIALLNQMKLPSAIGVALKLDSIEFNAVHDLSVRSTEDTVATADAASLPTDDGDDRDDDGDDDGDENDALETAVSIFRTLGS